jgi:hypothetical protein
MENEVRSQNYFIYKGVAYGIGTQVIFYEHIYKHIFNSKAINQPHTFTGGSSDGWLGFYWIDDTIPRPKIYYNNKSIYSPDEDIKEIVKPVYVELVPWQKQALSNMVNKTVSPDVFGGVLIYIVVMAIGALFKSILLIWVFATVVFIIWLLNQYRT